MEPTVHHHEGNLSVTGDMKVDSADFLLTHSPTRLNSLIQFLSLDLYDSASSEDELMRKFIWNIFGPNATARFAVKGFSGLTVEEADLPNQTFVTHIRTLNST